MTKLVLVSLQDRLPPLGLAYIASYYSKYKQDSDMKVEILTNKPDASPEKVAKRIRGADLVGISCFTPEYGKNVHLCKEIKERYDIPIILGGYHISSLPHTLPSSADIAVIGEGEQTMLELLELWQKHGFRVDRLKGVKGIAYHDQGEVKTTPRRALIEPLDKIPFPARDLIKDLVVAKPRWLGWGGKYTEGTCMISSRGCPYNCIFCAQSHFWQRPRFFSAEYFLSEIRELIEKYRAKAIYLWDDLFMANRTRLRKIVDLIEKERLNEQVEFYGYCRANLLDEEACILFKRMNVTYANFGLESGVEKVLDYLKRGTVTVEQNRRAVELCNKYEIPVGASFIIGSPGETAEDILQTMSFIKFLLRTYKKFGAAEIFLATPFPGTELWYDAKARGLVHEDHMDWEKFDFHRLQPEMKSLKNRIIVSDKLTGDEIWDLIKDHLEEIEQMVAARIRFELRWLFNLAFVYDFMSRPTEFAYKSCKVILRKVKDKLRGNARI